MSRRADGKNALARIGVGNESDIAEAEVLAVTFVVAEEEELVLRRMGPPREPPKLLRWNSGMLLLVEVVAGVEGAVAEELVGRAVELVGAAGGDDARSARPGACRRRRSRCR